MGIEEAPFSMSCIHLSVLWGERAVGPRHCWRLGEAALVICSYVLGDLYLLEPISKDVDCCGAVGLWGSVRLSPVPAGGKCVVGEVWLVRDELRGASTAFCQCVSGPSYRIKTFPKSAC